jgi:hypothetical protein
MLRCCGQKLTKHFGAVSKDRLRPWRPKKKIKFHAGGKDWSFETAPNAIFYNFEMASSLSFLENSLQRQIEF